MDYKLLKNKINDYKQKYNVKIIGKSVFGRNIFAVERVVNPKLSTAIFLCSIHAREHITTDLVCKMIDENLFDKITNFNLSFILMANPDGVELSTGGLQTAPFFMQSKLFKINNQKNDFSLWKANGRGVDLNNNFDANFGTNVHSMVPSASGFVGEFAESEPETQAVTAYTKSVSPFFTISYHSKGEEIYYNFFQSGKQLERDKNIAEFFASQTGYKIKNPESLSSGGYKDYCVQKLGIPAITIEVGSDSLTHPIGFEHLCEIYERHKSIASMLEYAYNTTKEFEGK